MPSIDNTPEIHYFLVFIKTKVIPKKYHGINVVLKKKKLEYFIVL